MVDQRHPTHLPASKLKEGILNDFMPIARIIPTNEFEGEIEFLKNSQTYPAGLAVILPSKEIEDARRWTAQERRTASTKQRPKVRHKSAR